MPHLNDNRTNILGTSLAVQWLRLCPSNAGSRVLSPVGCWGPALAGSRGHPQDERRQREKTRETSLDGAKSARERERKRERERENDQMGVAAESGKPLFFTVAFIF